MRPKYRNLRRHLSKSGLIRVDLNFDEVESLIGAHLPARARQTSSWWTAKNRFGFPGYPSAWLRAGYEVSSVGMDGALVRFRKRTDAPFRAKVVRYALLSFAIFILIAALLWLGPWALVGGLHLIGSAQASAENDARTTLVALLLALGAMGTFIFTARSYFLGRESHVTDRITNAVSQLGNSSPAIRLGGIYALRRIAQDSPRDASAVVAILCAYVVGESRSPLSSLRQFPSLAQRFATRPLRKSADPESGLLSLQQRKDIQTAASVAAKLSTRLPPLSLQLAGARLDGAYMWGIVAREASLDGTSMRRAYLANADWRQSWIRYAQLQDAWFTESLLQGVDFSHSQLNGANFSGAHLEGAIFHGADLTGANFAGAYLAGAYLGDADLRQAKGLTRRQLKDAILNSRTQIPRKMG
ncbi:MAG: pentapeptide repeat-containing protein [Steroidobacteraceae bacterium]